MPSAELPTTLQLLSFLGCFCFRSSHSSAPSTLLQ
uniref:Uncharacterized protein n=1 Tax=Oryza sativa subsp. japonica TaxID=39947 RepID=Q108W9_ORYSJ|nr:hypothetical protein LOC_Os10g42024 [Oryza sativa Japonica Group]